MGVREEHKKYNAAFFRKVAPLYDLSTLIVRPLRRRVAKKAPAGARVLDVACGTGGQSVAFAQAGASVTGIDLSPDMLVRARRNGAGYAITFLEGDASRLPFKSAAFDLSSISFAIHEMPEELAVATLKEMARVTKKGGRIVIVDYATPGTVNWLARLYESKYFAHFMKRGLDAYLKEAKLALVSRETAFLGNIQIVECKNK